MVIFKVKYCSEFRCLVACPELLFLVKFLSVHPENLQECLFPFAVRKDRYVNAVAAGDDSPGRLSLCAHDPLKSEFAMSDVSDNEDDLRLRPINDNASRGELINVCASISLCGEFTRLIYVSFQALKESQVSS